MACDASAGYLWDLRTKGRPQLARTLNGRQGSIATALFSRDSRQLFTAAKNGRIAWLDLSTPKFAETSLFNGDSTAVNDLSLSRDRRWLATAGEDRTVRLVNLADGAAAFRQLTGNQDAVLALDFNDDGSLLASGGQDRTVRLWKTSGGAAPESVIADKHAGGVFLVRFSADGHWLISGSLDGMLHLTDLTGPGPPPSPMVLNEKEIHFEAMYAGVDGRWFAATDDEGTAYLWDLAADDPRKSLRKFYGQPAAHTRLSLSPDSRWIAVGTASGAVRLWNLDQSASSVTGDTGTVLQGNCSAVTMVAFTADNRHVVAASEDGSVRMWNLNLEDVLDQAALLSSRNLTLGEWRKTFANLPYQKTFDSLPGP